MCAIPATVRDQFCRRCSRTMPSRQHLSQQPHRRRPSLIDYSRRLATRMGINRPLPPATAAPSSSAVGSPRRPSHSNPTIEFGTSRTKEARCRFYYCVSIGIIFGLAVNIASTMFVVHRLRATRESASSQRSERLRNQVSCNVAFSFTCFNLLYYVCLSSCSCSFMYIAV